MPQEMVKSLMPWFLYLLECQDKSIYTGIARDVEARFAKHIGGSGARYTRSRRPQRILARLGFPDRSSASKAEWAVKQLSRREKWVLCEILSHANGLSKRRS